jgi:hypothetical protein
VPATTAAPASAPAATGAAAASAATAAAATGLEEDAHGRAGLLGLDEVPDLVLRSLRYFEFDTTITHSTGVLLNAPMLQTSSRV